MRRATMMLVVGTLLVALSAGIAVAAVVQGEGLGDEIPNRNKCKDTDQGDFITGNSHGETIEVLAGEDQVNAGGGNDNVAAARTITT